LITGADEIAAARRWRKITQSNSFVDEYEPVAPIVVKDIRGIAKAVDEAAGRMISRTDPRQRQ
jgi:hypothetical protein